MMLTTDEVALAVTCTWLGGLKIFIIIILIEYQYTSICSETCLSGHLYRMADSLNKSLKII